MKPLILATILSFGGDALGTHLAITKGTGREANLPTQNPWIIDGIVAGETAAVAFGLNRLHKTHPKFALALGWSVVGARTPFTVHSLQIGAR